MIGDTWLAGTTWRLPFRNAPTSDDYQPGPGIGFEDAIRYRKNQGFNSVSMIAAFPNWEADVNPSTYADENGIYSQRLGEIRLRCCGRERNRRFRRPELLGHFHGYEYA